MLMYIDALFSVTVFEIWNAAHSTFTKGEKKISLLAGKDTNISLRYEYHVVGKKV